MIKSFRKENPVVFLINNWFIDLPAPYNLNYLWNWGSLLGICLIIQMISGIFLAMHYCSDIELAFSSVVHITRDINYGFVLRYLHVFLCVFLMCFFNVFINI